VRAGRQAFVLYEENLADSKAQLAAITQIVGALQGARSFSAENYDTLTTKCALYANKLLKKPDQCLAIQLCAHLFWTTPRDGSGVVAASTAADDTTPSLHRDGKRVLECLQKSLKIADACMEATVNVALFVEILNRYLFFYERRTDAIGVRYVNGLLDLIAMKTSGMDASEESDAIHRHLRNTLAYVQLKKTREGAGAGPSYDEVTVPAISR
jgi:vacuolar protein sorting-associated protein 35